MGMKRNQLNLAMKKREQETTNDDQSGLTGIDVEDVPEIIAEENGEEITGINL
jgi:hypothetical protein